MKCPYIIQTVYKHEISTDGKPSEGEIKHYFGECYEEECPFYRHDSRYSYKDMCLRIGNE